MSEVNLKCKFKIKQDSKANWLTNNPILLDGELGLYQENNFLCIVLGDGVNPFNKLKVYYIPNHEITASGGASDEQIRELNEKIDKKANGEGITFSVEDGILTVTYDDGL